MTARVKNMTSGSPGKLILFFAIPLMFGNIFQQLYTMVDTMVVGQVVGVKALAALGAVDWIVWMILGIASGMTQGFSILVSQYYGAQNWEGLKKAVARSYILTAILSAAVLAVSQAAAYPLLLFLNTPADIMGMALSYLRVALCGVPFIAAYNCLASMLRAVGNSKSPLVAMILAALINIGLDLLFVAGFGWGVAGAAAATVIGQTFSAVYCYLVVRKIQILRIKKKDFKGEPGMDKTLLGMGVPVSLQNIIIAVGGLAIQFAINGYGSLVVAGFTATNKMYGILELAGISYGYAITAYVGQNLGAREIGRIRRGVKSGAVMAVATSLFMSVVMLIAGRFILGLFISGNPAQTEQVLDVAYRYLFILSVCLWILYLLYVFRSAIQGLGNTLLPMLSGVAELFVRVIVVLILPVFMGRDGIYFAEIGAWISAVVILIPGYKIILKKFS